MPSTAESHPRTAHDSTVQKLPFATLKGMARALGRVTLIIMLVLLVAFLAIWYATPYFVRDMLNKKGEGLPQYHLHIQWVQINPWNCSIDVEGVTLAKEGMSVPYFACPRVRTILQWREVLRGDLRASIDLTSPRVNFVQGPTPESSQIILDPEWVKTVKAMVPLRINQFTIEGGEIHFYDFHANPQIDMVMDQLNLSLDNLTNTASVQTPMPSTAVLTARPFRVGLLDARVALNVDLKQPTFAEKVRIEHIPAVEFNAFLAKYAKVYAKSGVFNFYTEMVSEKGSYTGYAKPFFQDLQFEPVPKDHGGLAALWASLVNGAKDLIQNDDKNVATKVPISGHYTDPNIDFWSAAFGLVANAWLQALAQGFDTPELAPAPEKQEINPAAEQTAGSPPPK
jgi:hypothetical protein